MTLHINRMDILLAIFALLFVVIGMIGCIVPILPGVVLAYAGLLCCYFCSFSAISTTAVFVWLAVTVFVSIADYFLPAYMSKIAGGTKAGVRGATAGMLIGLLLGSIVGAIIGPFIGAVVGELLHDSKDASKALKVGFGSFLSFLVGTGLKLAACIGMLFAIWGNIWPVVKEWVVSIF